MLEPCRGKRVSARLEPYRGKEFQKPGKRFNMLIGRLEFFDLLRTRRLNQKEEYNKGVFLFSTRSFCDSFPKACYLLFFPLNIKFSRTIRTNFKRKGEIIRVLLIESIRGNRFLSLENHSLKVICVGILHFWFEQIGC